MIDRTTLLEAYDTITFARQLDDRVHTLCRSGAAMVFWFPWHGTELIAAAIGQALRRDDYLVSYYRDGGTQLAKGAEPNQLFAEVMGKATGTQKGKSGFCHTIDLDVGLVMNSGVVGGQLPVANGWALSSVIRGDDRVTVVTFGDGAVNEGAFHETLTLASLWKLPIVFVCFNNQVAEHTVFTKTSPTPTVADRCVAYAIPAHTVPGNDYVQLSEVMNAAVERARAGEGPTLVEAVTHRARGHHHFDQQSYLGKEAVDEALADDPVPQFRAWMLEQGHATEEELAAMDAAAAVKVEEAWEFANSSPPPDISELYTDVYAPAGEGS